MIKLGANSVLFAGYDLETAMRCISWAGYDGVELSAIKGMCEHLELDRYKSQVGDIRNLAEKYELDLLAMEEAGLDEERLVLAFEAAAELGIPVVNVGPGGKMGSDEDFRRQTELLQRMGEKAAAFGVVLCAKAHVRQSIHDTPTTLKAMEAIPSQGFGVDMDPSHIYRAGGGSPGPPEDQACGRGGIDLFGYLRVLHEADIDVAVDLEVIGAGEYELPRVATIAAESRGYLNACLRACDDDD